MHRVQFLDGRDFVAQARPDEQGSFEVARERLYSDVL